MADAASSSGGNDNGDERMNFDPLRSFTEYIQNLEKRVKSLELEVAALKQSDAPDLATGTRIARPHSAQAISGEEKDEKGTGPAATVEHESKDGQNAAKSPKTTQEKPASYDVIPETRMSTDPKWFWREAIHHAQRLRNKQPDLFVEEDAQDSRYAIEILEHPPEAISPDPNRAQTKSVLAAGPQYIRINSLHIVDFLNKAAPKARLRQFKTHNAPYKLFVKYETQIRALYAELSKATPTSYGEAESQALDAETEVNGHSTESAKSAVASLTGLDHISLLIVVLDGPLAKILAKYRAIRSAETDVVAFDELWYLFQPDDEIIAPEEGDTIYRISGAAGGRVLARYPPNANSPELIDRSKDLFLLDTFRYGFDGSSYGLVVPNPLVIEHFFGVRRVITLKYYPLKFSPKLDQIRRNVTYRIKLFSELVRENEFHSKHYTGIARRAGDLQRYEEVDSPVIVDHNYACAHRDFPTDSFDRLGGWTHDGREATANVDADCTKVGCNCGRLSVLLFWDFSNEQSESLELRKPRNARLVSGRQLNDVILPQDEILLRTVVYGYDLRAGDWLELRVESLRAPMYGNGFRRLILPDGYEDAIKSLVDTTSFGNLDRLGQGSLELAASSVRNRDQGLTIVLHGESGIGKSTTAECIADYAGRPLLYTTGPDIDESARDVEQNFGMIISLARRWGCVILVEETEAILKQGQSQLQEKTSIIKAFQRTFEAYNGILVLSAKEIAPLSTSWRSRVNLALHFPKLSMRATVALWKKKLESEREECAADNTEIVINEEEILQCVARHYRRLVHEHLPVWNGRQIDNAFNLAVKLARSESQETDGQDASRPIVLGARQLNNVFRSAGALEHTWSAG